jgi:hypothetical protein
MTLDTNWCEKAIQLLIKARGISSGNTGSTPHFESGESPVSHESSKIPILTWHMHRKAYGDQANDQTAISTNTILQKNVFSICIVRKYNFKKLKENFEFFQGTVSRVLISESLYPLSFQPFPGD